MLPSVILSVIRISSRLQELSHSNLIAKAYSNQQGSVPGLTTSVDTDPTAYRMHDESDVFVMDTQLKNRLADVLTESSIKFKRVKSLVVVLDVISHEEVVQEMNDHVLIVANSSKVQGIVSVMVHMEDVEPMLEQHHSRVNVIMLNRIQKRSIAGLMIEELSCSVLQEISSLGEVPRPRSLHEDLSSHDVVVIPLDPGTLHRGGLNRLVMAGEGGQAVDGEEESCKEEKELCLGHHEVDSKGYLAT